jgi:hypothetical protein
MWRILATLPDGVVAAFYDSFHATIKMKQKI